MLSLAGRRLFGLSKPNLKMIVGYSRLKFKRKKIRYCIFWLLTQCDIAGKLIYIYNKNAVYKMLNQSSPIFKASVHLYFCCMGFLEASDFFWRRLSLEDAPMSILIVYWEHKAFTSLYCLLSEVLTFEMLNEVGLRDSLCFTLGFFFFSYWFVIILLLNSQLSMDSWN